MYQIKNKSNPVVSNLATRNRPPSSRLSRQLPEGRYTYKYKYQVQMQFPVSRCVLESIPQYNSTGRFYLAPTCTVPNYTTVAHQAEASGRFRYSTSTEPVYALVHRRRLHSGTLEPVQVLVQQSLVEPLLGSETKSIIMSIFHSC
jgi:hypothetical protein